MKKKKSEMKAILYLRSAEKTEKNSSIRRQEKKLADYCSKHEMEVIKEFTDYASGDTLDRPGWKQLTLFLKESRHSNTVLLVSSFDRCTRRFSHAMEIIQLMEETGVSLIEAETGKDITKLFFNNSLQFVLENVTLKIK